jgi:Protein of unknown function (DUF3489)
LKDLCGGGHFSLAFPADRSDESSCANEAQKRIRRNQHDQRRNQHSRHPRGTGRHSRAGEGPLEEGCHSEEGRAQGPESAKGNKTKPAAPKKDAKASKKAAKPARAKEASMPRAESKGAKILDMIGRAKGATLAEIMKATEWQAHSVRGFLSTAAKKHGLKIESTKTEAGDRVYKIAK